MEVFSLLQGSCCFMKASFNSDKVATLNPNIEQYSPLFILGSIRSFRGILGSNSQEDPSEPLSVYYYFSNQRFWIPPMEKQSGLINVGLWNNGMCRGHCFFQCPSCVQWRQTLQGRVLFLNGGSLGSGLKCVCGGLLGPWSCYNFRATNWLAFLILSFSKVSSKCLARSFFFFFKLGLLIQQER